MHGQRFVDAVSDGIELRQCFDTGGVAAVSSLRIHIDLQVAGERSHEGDLVFSEEVNQSGTGGFLQGGKVGAKL